MNKPSADQMMWASKLINKYRAEANQQLVPCWESHKGFEGYGYFESILTYAIIREIKPKIIFEISPACGMSTYPLALAIRANEMGKIYSFEINPEFVAHQKENLRRWGLQEHVETIEGNVKETYKKVLEEITFFDVLFMDSDHGEEMAKFYMTKLWPQTVKFMHIHDFYYLPNDGEIQYIKKFMEKHPKLKWISSKYLYMPDFTLDETHGEANSSIWIKKPEFPSIVKKWRDRGVMFE